jgi:UDP-N-acetylmuramoyl-tripeptide--D-alanyl-D-alanine ligase
MILWTDKTAQEATEGAAQGTWQALRVEIDSRRVQRGDLFVALKGETFDGHDFVRDAFAKGAVAALVERVPKDISGHFIIVPDVLKGLEHLARFSRRRSRAAIIGLTGSVGKTSTKEMLRLALAPHGKVFASHGNYNNHIGLPLNLANLPPDANFAVFEMGMNHAGEIAALTAIAKPNIAIVTGVDAVHLEFFASVDAIADAKAEIFEGVTPDGIAILNADNAQFSRLKKAATAHKLSIVACGDTAGCRVLEYRAVAAGASVKASIAGKNISYVLGAIGRHWAHTSVLALATVQALELDVEKSASALAAFNEPEGRGQVLHIHIPDGELLLIDDSYNASPVSMRAAFAKTVEVWRGAGGEGRKIAALGDMLELGHETEALHKGLAKDLEEQGFDAVFTAGQHMQALHDALPSTMQCVHAKNVQALKPLLLNTLQHADVVLIKGSHGSKMYELAAALKEHHGELKHAL